SDEDRHADDADGYDERRSEGRRMVNRMALSFIHLRPAASSAFPLAFLHSTGYQRSSAVSVSSAFHPAFHST
ncbi:MAG TPA: hypothetical protein PLV08_15835, partial [Flavobacteriales bacterium]|nr:hypothetical protein [Flavobacteriales bacterium]